MFVARSIEESTTIGALSKTGAGVITGAGASWSLVFYTLSASLNISFWIKALVPLKLIFVAMSFAYRLTGVRVSTGSGTTTDSISFYTFSEFLHISF